MKKIIDVLSIALISLGAVYLMVGSFAKDDSSEFAQNFNKYNILVNRSAKYAKIDNSSESLEKNENDDGKYTYYLDSFDRHGKLQEVEFSTPVKFKQNQYIKLDTKGSDVKSYKAITRDDMPYKIDRKLRTYSIY